MHLNTTLLSLLGLLCKAPPVSDAPFCCTLASELLLSSGCTCDRQCCHSLQVQDYKKILSGICVLSYHQQMTCNCQCPRKQYKGRVTSAPHEW